MHLVCQAPLGDVQQSLLACLLLPLLLSHSIATTSINAAFSVPCIASIVRLYPQWFLLSLCINRADGLHTTGVSDNHRLAICRDSGRRSRALKAAFKYSEEGNKVKHAPKRMQRHRAEGVVNLRRICVVISLEEDVHVNGTPYTLYPFCRGLNTHDYVPKLSTSLSFCPDT